MGNSTMDEDLQLMAQVYTALVKSPPTSLDFNDLYPKMLGLVAKVNDQSVAFKTYQYTTSPDFEASIAAFSNAPSMTQAMTWDVITKHFKHLIQIQDLPIRHVTRDYMKSILFLCITTCYE